jgi:hypothetical protein
MPNNHNFDKLIFKENLGCKIQVDFLFPLNFTTCQRYQLLALLLLHKDFRPGSGLTG